MSCSATRGISADSVLCQILTALADSPLGARSAAASSGSDRALSSASLAANCAGSGVVSSGRSIASLVRPGQGELAQEGSGIELEGDQLLAQELHQVRMTRRVGRVMQVDGMHESASHHHGPEPVRDILVEGAIAAAGGERGQPGPPAESGHGQDLVGGLHRVLFTGREDRLGQLGIAGDPGARPVVIALDEYGVEREIACPPSRRGKWSSSRLPCESGHTRG